MDLSEQYQHLSQMLISGNAPGVGKIVNLLVEENEAPRKILDEGLLPAMDIVGEKFKKNEFFVPQVLFAARAMNAGMAIIKPLLLASGKMGEQGTVLIGTARGDQHDIGKNLVGMMLESAGYRVVDLGTDVSPQKFMEATEREKAKVISISALMTTTMSAMNDVISEFKRRGLREDVRIIVGGAPLTAQFATQIGADGYGENATEAVSLVKSLLMKG